MSNPYHILRDLCQVRDESIASRKTKTLSKRGEFIFETLESAGLKPYLSRLEGNFTNINVTLQGKSEDSIAYTSHYDISNINSDNCNDNSASCSILISYAILLSKQKIDKTVHIIFPDGEEVGGIGGRGLANEINQGLFGNVKWVLNLELCGLGDVIFIDDKENELWHDLKNDEIDSVGTPFNDAVTLRMNGITSTCIGLIPSKELQEAKQTGYCDHWGLCHSRNDKFERASEKNMLAFLGFLEGKYKQWSVK